MVNEDDERPPAGCAARMLCEACQGTGAEDGADWMDPASAPCRVCYGSGELDESDPHDPEPMLSPGRRGDAGDR